MMKRGQEEEAEKWGRNVSSSMTSSDGVIIKFQGMCMQ
jgi:hypothetical protein